MAQVLQKIDTGLNADTVEWCPYEGLENILLCGTYKLQEKADNDQETSGKMSTENVEQTRVGGVSTYSLEFKEGCQPFLKEHSKLEMCGVLDIKWPDQKMDNKAVFGLVDAEGFCQLFTVNNDALTSEEICKAKLSNSSLGLSLGFSSCDERGKQQVVASDSAGFLTVLNIDRAFEPALSWYAHEYEAWITAFHKFDGNFVFSGGDDCRLKGWDIRDHSRPVFISKRHQMGVCSVQSHPFDENIFASGSYDEKVLVWDRRVMKTPLTGISLGGGIWRIKWNPNDGACILTATMYNGTHVVDYKADTASMRIVAHYDDHNLAYGADWCRLNTHGKPLTCQSNSLKGNIESCLIATCSFYDHALHLWEWTGSIK